jgi:hypothetical protein
VGTNSSTYTTSSLANNDVVYVVATFNNTLCTVNSPANSNSITTSVNQASSSTETQSACSSYVWHGTTYTTSGAKTWTGTNAAGCDSVVTLNLTIKQPSSSSSSQSACSSYVWHGTTYTTSGAKTWTGTNAAGCDSVVTLNLTINQATSSSSSESACGSYVWHGTTYTTSGAKTWTGTNAAGCDSVVTLNLTIKQPTSSSSSETACGSYVWHGTTYTSSGAKTWTGTNAVGCDSVVTLNLTIKQVSNTSVSQSATGSYVWHAQTYNSSGIYTWTGTNAVGCDSIVLLDLTINQLLITNAVNVCTYIGTNQTLTYTANVAGASSYTWSLPSNIQLVSGQGTRTIVIKILNGFAAQVNKQIRVTPAGGSLQIFYLAAQTPVTPAAITASTANICGSIGTNVPVSYKIPKVYETASNAVTASSYFWTSQNGTTTISHPNGSGENDTTITITFASNFTSSNVSVQALNACGVSTTRSYFISRNNPSQPSIISGPTNTCEYIGDNGQAASYSVSGSTSVDSYTWTVPQGAIGLIGLGTNTISFKYPAGYTGGSISVTATNNCGTSQARSLTVSRLTPSTPGNIDVINTATCPNREFTYSVANLPSNATSMLWTVPASGTILSGQGTSSITVSYPGTVVDGYVTTKAVSNCGTSSTRTLVIRLAPCPASPSPQYTKGVMSKTSSSMEIKVFPNPTTNLFNLKVSTSSVENAKARLLDVQGRLIKTISINPNETITLGSDLKPGVYMVEVLNGEEKKVVRMVKY